MKNQIPYQSFSSFVLRSPLFPFEFTQFITAKKHTSEEELKELCKRADIQEAVFLASPSLHTELNKWLNGELTDKKEVEKLQYSLTKYLSRMSTRCTPFGLFAGFSVGNYGEQNNIEFPVKDKYTRHTRLDMNYLCALAQDLAKHPNIKEKIKYFPNSSIYELGHQLRYVEYRYIKTNRAHHIVAVDQSDYLTKVLAKASQGGALFNELAELLVDKEISLEEAKEFIQELITSQLLVNELEPAITGPEFLDQILQVFDNIEGAKDFKPTLVKAKNDLQSIDNSSIGTPVSAYLSIADQLKALGTEYELKFLFQTDMVKPTIHCTLEERIIDDIMKGIDVLNKLTPSPSETNVTQFRSAFYERYEDREVPLLQALDTESGIGYRQNNSDVSGDVTPLVDDIMTPGVGRGGMEIRWDGIQSMLFKKYTESLVSKATEITITDEDLKQFEARWDDLPLTFSSMVSILDYDPEKGPMIHISSAGGSSSANLLGRFCHADKQMSDYVQEITKKEKELIPDAIFAEIIHLPESRIGNILLRPVLREHEIPYLAKPAVSEEFQIKLEDLMLSVVGNRIILRSKRLNKEILPRLSSAHNFSYNALPIYQFLCDLQTQNIRGGVGFNWGSLSGEYPFLPRVTYKNLILSYATWNVRSEDVKSFYAIKDDEELLKAVEKWRKEKNIPAMVALADSDNELFINLENTLSIKTLLSVVKNRPGFQLIEFLFSPEKAIVKSKEGTYTNQFVFSFFKKLDNNKK